MTRVERLDEEIAVFLLTRAGKRKCRGTSSSCIAKYKEFAILLISISLDDAHPRSKIDIYKYSHECSIGQRSRLEGIEEQGNAKRAGDHKTGTTLYIGYTRTILHKYFTRRTGRQVV